MTGDEMELVSTHLVKNYLAEKEELKDLPNCGFESLQGHRYFIKDGDFFHEGNNSASRTSFENIPVGKYRVKIVEVIKTGE